MGEIERRFKLKRPPCHVSELEDNTLCAARKNGVIDSETGRLGPADRGAVLPSAARHPGRTSTVLPVRHWQTVTVTSLSRLSHLRLPGPLAGLKLESVEMIL